ncbi:MAG TPA: hypothetical protein VH440_09175, partial [Candidatus Limnocylindrales bacterium]
FDVPRFVSSAFAAGLSAPYLGVEIISESFRRQPLEVMARTAFEATTRAIRPATIGRAEANRP